MVIHTIQQFHQLDKMELDAGESHARRHRASTLSSLQEQTTDLENTELTDSGRKPARYYQEHLSLVRYQIRDLLMPLVGWESEVLFNIQKACRTDLADVYFTWTANLGSHTFYVLMLPLPLWFGYAQLTRDLVFVIGWGIFFSGWVKDYLCLPRPKSPPLHRITMSHYTAQEYGCPSSHSANATGVTLVVLLYCIQHSNDWLSLVLMSSLMLLYYFSLIFGRIYCGMHGFTDIAMGSVIGFSCFLFRHFTRDAWDALIYNHNSWYVPLCLVLFYYVVTYLHPVPLEECPCYEDSALFMGVMCGLEIASFYLNVYFADQSVPVQFRCTIPYSYEQVGLIKTLLRLLVGVSMVVVWKLVSKDILLLALTPVFNLLESKGLVKKLVPNNCWLLKSRTGVELVVRMIVYAGISLNTLLAHAAFSFLGLGAEFRLEDYY